MTPVDRLNAEIAAAGGTTVVSRWPPEVWPDAESAWIVRVDPTGAALLTAERNQLHVWHEFPDEQAAVEHLRPRVVPGLADGA